MAGFNGVYAIFFWFCVFVLTNRWKGQYFGFIYRGKFFDANGNYLGWIEDDKVWDSSGNFLGEIIEENYILRRKTMTKPVLKVPKVAPVPPVPPVPKIDKVRKIPRPNWIDALDEFA